ncbi:MAG: ATP-grasp domain-containing protein [Ignavibacteriaceae bacterium]|nr:ATP-grasp domain-containing protein [Ignavibacteriaceae bacterium]
MKINANILICYNSPVSIFSVYSGKPAVDGEVSNDLSESGFSNELKIITKSLKERFSNVASLPIDLDAFKSISAIQKKNPKVIFNFVESVEGISAYEYCMAGIYELLGVRYTGSLPSSLGNCLNKYRTKNILRASGISTPRSYYVKCGELPAKKSFNLNLPVILKLNTEDASIGISELSVVKNFTGVTKRLKFLFETYKQDVIIEEYIEGRELNAAVLGSSVLPISEICFGSLPSHLPKIVTYEGKWIADTVYYEHTKPQCPAKLSKNIKKKVEETALAAFEAMNCRDYARVDIRLAKDGTPYVIEVNPNPDISTDSGFARAANAAGLSYGDLLFNIANFALARHRDDTQNKAS